MYLTRKGGRRESDADHMGVGRDLKAVEEAEDRAAHGQRTQTGLSHRRAVREGGTGQKRQGTEGAEGPGHGSAACPWENRTGRGACSPRPTYNRGSLHGPRRGERRGGGALGHRGQPEDEPALRLRQKRDWTPGNSYKKRASFVNALFL